MTHSNNIRPGAATGWKARIQHLVVVVSAKCGLKLLLLSTPQGYLRTSGWMLSARKARPLDTGGNAQPWLTMPAIRFLSERLSVAHLLFEYGSGGSTVWFAAHAGKVVSVEHHEGWYNEVRQQLPENAVVELRATPAPGAFLDLVFRPIGAPSEYALSVTSLPPRPPDVVVIDGIDRLNSIRAALAAIDPRGVIVVDNLEYEDAYRPGVELLTAAGFRQIAFWGLAPSELRESCTGLFYRPENCFGI